MPALSPNPKSRLRWRQNAPLLLLGLMLFGGSLWNYRQDLLNSLPPDMRQTLTFRGPDTASASFHFPDPADAPPAGTPVPRAALPPFDARAFAAFKPESEEGSEFLCEYVQDAVGYDGLGDDILHYPESLRYLWGMCLAEFHILGEGFNGYFFNGQAEGLRFAREGYLRISQPDVAAVMAEAESRFLLGMSRYEDAHRQAETSLSEESAWKAFVSAGQDLNLDTLDTKWEKAFRHENVFRARHAYASQHLGDFGPPKK